MKLDMRFTARGLEDLWCQTVVVLVFQGPAGKADGVSGLDKKTSGYLTYLWERGFWTGANGDMLLLASQNMIKADKILLKGLGVRSEYSIELLTKRIKEIGIALDGLGVNDIGIHIPVVKGLAVDFFLQLESACVHLVDTFLVRYKDDPGFLLKVVVSVNRGFISGLKSTVQSLRECFGSRLDCTIISEREEAQPLARGVFHGLSTR